MKMYHIILYIAFIAVLVSCKKERKVQEVNGVLNTTAVTAKSWFDANVTKSSKTFMPILGEKKPDWSETKFVKDQNLYIIPVTEKSNSKAIKLFIEQTDLKNNIINGWYYVILDKTEISIEKAILTAEEYQKGKSPQNLNTFSGAILTYDINYALIKTDHYTNGKLTDNIDYIITKEKKENSNKSSTTNNLQSECESGEEQECIDWYWQTYINGELVMEEYLFTTCSCIGNTGGSGNNNTSTVLCNLTPAQAQANLNALTLEFSIRQYYVIGTPSVPDFKGIIRAPVTRKGEAYKLTFAPGWVAWWTATYTGIVYKNSKIPNDQWKWESLQSVGFVQDEGSIPPCISVLMFPAIAPPVISPDPRYVNTAGSFTGEVKWTCIGDVKIKSINGTFSAMFVADNVSQ